jgi:hypothetical protein
MAKQSKGKKQWQSKGKAYGRAMTKHMESDDKAYGKAMMKQKQTKGKAKAKQRGASSLWMLGCQKPVIVLILTRQKTSNGFEEKNTPRPTQAMLTATLTGTRSSKLVHYENPRQILSHPD